jgi:hypothetical protein
MIREELRKTGSLVAAVTKVAAWYNALDRESPAFHAVLDELRIVEWTLACPPSLLAVAEEIAGEAEDEETAERMLLERMDGREHPQLASALGTDLRCRARLSRQRRAAAEASRVQATPAWARGRRAAWSRRQMIPLTKANFSNPSRDGLREASRVASSSK